MGPRVPGQPRRVHLDGEEGTGRLRGDQEVQPGTRPAEGVTLPGELRQGLLDRRRRPGGGDQIEQGLPCIRGRNALTRPHVITLPSGRIGALETEQDPVDQSEVMATGDADACGQQGRIPA